MSLSACLLYFSFLLTITISISPDNVCTFHIGGKLFSLVYLQKQQPYKF